MANLPGSAVGNPINRTSVTRSLMKGMSCRMTAIAATAFFLLIGFTQTTVAQAPRAGEGEARYLQAGPMLGTSIYREVTVEYGLLIGVRRGSWLWDATLTGFTSRFRLPPVSHQSFEGLVGFGWYPASGAVSAGAGGRIGIAYTANSQGQRKPRPVAGPYLGLDVRLGRALVLHSEAGAHIYFSDIGPGGPRGYVRTGIQFQTGGVFPATVGSAATP